MSQFDPTLNQQGFPVNTDLDAFGNRLHVDTILMASSSLSAGTAISVTNFAGRGALFYMNITSAFPGSGSTTYTLKIQLRQPNAVNSAVTLCACAPMSASGVSTLVVFPGALRSSTAPSTSVNAALAVMGCPLPRNFSVVVSLSTGATSKEVVMSLGMTTIY